MGTSEGLIVNRLLRSVSRGLRSMTMSMSMSMPTTMTMFMMMIIIIIMVMTKAVTVRGADTGGLTSREVMTLLTEKEGAMKSAPSGSFEIGRVTNTGPRIEVVEPKIEEGKKPPLKVIILFLAKEGQEIDLSTLKVECLKFVTIDLTDRVLPYTTKQGINIENAKLPSGKHTLRLTIGDVQGGMTQEVFNVQVF